jgi:hypothetical protein
MGRRASEIRESRPKMWQCPEVGCTAESSIFTNVVFPAPLGPRNPNVVPRGTWIECYPRRETPGVSRSHGKPL